MTDLVISKRRKIDPDKSVSDGFLYRGVRINRFFKPTKRTQRIEAAVRKVMQDRLAESAVR